MCVVLAVWRDGVGGECKRQRPPQTMPAAATDPRRHDGRHLLLLDTELIAADIDQSQQRR